MYTSLYEIYGENFSGFGYHRKHGLISPLVFIPKGVPSWRVSFFVIPPFIFSTWLPVRPNASPPEPSLCKLPKKVRQFESFQAEGEDNPLPTRTPIDAVLTAYVSHIRNVKTAKSAQTDIYYLRDAFGPSLRGRPRDEPKVSASRQKRPPKPWIADAIHVDRKD